MFKWGVAQEIVRSETYQALRAVDGLKRGRTNAPDNPPVEPVGESQINAVIKHAPEAVGAMVQSLVCQRQLCWCATRLSQTSDMRFRYFHS